MPVGHRHREIRQSLEVPTQSFNWFICANIIWFFRIVGPKKAKLDEALDSLKEKQALLAEAQAKLAELNMTLQKLEKEYEEKLEQKEELNRKVCTVFIQGVAYYKLEGLVENVKILAEKVVLKKYCRAFYKSSKGI